MPPGIRRLGALARTLCWLFAALLAWGGSAQATPESGSLIATPDGQVLIVANQDAGSVAKIDRQTGRRLAERRLGRDIRRVALSADGSILAATDMLGGRLHLLQSEGLEPLTSVAVGRRPFGVVHDPVADVFWVTAFESAELWAVDTRGRVRTRIATRETPRGLALLRDRRLLVSHALLGEISIFDLAADPPAQVGTIALAATENEDAFVSQGVPRLLDDIAVSPDQSEAWLPHVLWSFDHPFQFRSSVFPAISVVSLERGRERELPSRRKELFRQIDIQDGEGRTRIVSNPHDVAFAPDGSKAYATFAGSEDLVVFDLSRRARPGAERRSRRRGKRSQGGAQAIQIVRHLPGDLPQGLVVQDDEIFVQGASSLDLARLTRGGDGPFARAKVADAVFARTVESDPLPPEVRRGQRLFFSGNSDDYPEHPPTGDFWMSCGSCHLDGFNFTNRQLMRDATRSPRSRPGFAVTGHERLRTLVASDFVGDYVRMFQDTQGGLGADERMGLPRVDPDAPPPEVATRMNELHAFVTQPENLPFLSTWLRVEGAVAESSFSDSAQCGTCHSDLYAQWRTSNHRLMATSHPYYRVLEDLAAESEGEAFRAWCMGCHNPKHLIAGRPSSHGAPGAAPPGSIARLESGSPSPDPLDEGTDCLFCHRVQAVEHAGGNASLSVNLQDRERYPFEASAFRPLAWLGERLIDARPSVHARSYLRSDYADPTYCGSCHSEFAPGSGAVISDTYAEWEASPYNATVDSGERRTCADCHMHGDTGALDRPVPGLATDGGAEKPNVRAHRFSGGNVDLVALRDPEAAEQSLALLRSAAELDAAIEEGALRVRVRNVGAGHHLPTGVTDLRQLWLHVKVWDTRGQVVLESGALAPDRTLGGDARIFHKILGDAEGQPVGLRFWRYETLLRDTRIPAGEHRDETFALPPEIAWPLRVEIELRFRTFPEWVTRRVRERYPDLPEPRVHTLARLACELRGS